MTKIKRTKNQVDFNTSMNASMRILDMTIDPLNKDATDFIEQQSQWR